MLPIWPFIPKQAILATVPELHTVARSCAVLRPFSEAAFGESHCARLQLLSDDLLLALGLYQRPLMGGPSL